jgi:hypothetical protein
MANTYIQIGNTVTVGSGGAATIDFTSIPATYTDLIFVFSLRQSAANNNIRLSVNGTTSGYSESVLYGNGSAAFSTTAGTSYFNLLYTDGSGETASTFGNGQVYIPNYAGSTNKSMSADTVSENNATSALAVLTALLWSNTAAITSLSLAPVSGTWVQHSTASLYGIKKN